MSFSCKILIADRNYSSWHYTAVDESKQIDPPDGLSVVSPIDHKLFTRDIIELNAGQPPKLVFSPVRTHSVLAGVLLLENNKTFGRNETKKRLLYKCVPDDKHLPAFLIPYELKMGFSKRIHNKYVVFKFDHWKDKHPHGILHEVLGDVGALDVFYEYQLYCKSLHISMNEFNDQTRNTLKQHTNDEYIDMITSNPAFRISVLPPSSAFIFSIDPPTSTDFDDAFSIVAGSLPGVMRISVYIANVYLWLETLGLWKSFSKRVSTIYLPDRKRPMLPTLLSDTLCSLQENTARFAFVMDVDVDVEKGEIIEDSIVFSNKRIVVGKNYRYEEPALLDDDHYQSLLRCTQTLRPDVRDSHDLVVYWMIKMNHLCGIRMARARTGIFRSMSLLCKDRTEEIPAHLDAEVRRVLSVWNNTIGQYCVIGEETDIKHDLMKLSSYIHITSPIRRLVDLLNQILFMREFGCIGDCSPECGLFLSDWISQLDYINTAMRSIRKVQSDCELLRKCTTDPEILEREHSGVVFDRVVKADGLCSYMVYLDKVGLLSRIHTPVQMEDYTMGMFRIFVFEDEHRAKKKIRLQMV